MTSSRLFAQFNLALVVFMMAGCANLFTLPSESSVPHVSLAPQVSLEQRVLEQFRTVQKMSPEQFETELPVLELAYAQAPNMFNRLCLAISLGFGQCQKCDSAHALKLFKETLQSSQDDSILALASLSIELLESKAMMTDKNLALANLQQQVKQLQQKLNDLTSIEESLHLRE